MFTRSLANSSLFVGSVLLIYSGALTVQRYNPARLTFSSLPAYAAVADYQMMPARVVAKQAGIDTPIKPVDSYERKWELTSDGASFLTSSQLPGRVGNSIMYGHNWSNIFGNLQRVKPGDFIEVYMNNGERRVFGVIATQIVDPDAIEVLKPASDRHLTLYTCTGFLDSKRFVVSATLQSEIR